MTERLKRRSHPDASNSIRGNASIPYITPAANGKIHKELHSGERGIRLNVDDTVVSVLDTLLITTDVVSSGESIREYIKRKSGLDIENSDDLRRIKSAYEKAISMVAKLLHIDNKAGRGKNRSLESRLKVPVIESARDVEDVFKSLPREGENWEKIEFVKKAKKTLACAIVKVALAYIEADEMGVRQLLNRTIALSEQITSDMQSGKAPFTFKDGRMKLSHSCAEIKFSNTVSGTICFRTKELESIIIKLMRRAEYDAEKAASDSAGMRFELNEKGIPSAILNFVKYMTESGSYIFQDGRIEIDAKNIKLSNEVVNELRQICSKHGIGFVLEEGIPNKESGSRYRAVNVVVSGFELPNKGKMSLEAQFVPIANKNERGLENHHIYDIFKRITIMTRLFGSVNQDWLKEEVARAVKEAYGGRISQKQLEEVEKNIYNGILYDKRICFIKRRGDNRIPYKIAARHVYEGWLTSGILNRADFESAVMFKSN